MVSKVAEGGCSVSLVIDTSCSLAAGGTTTGVEACSSGLGDRGAKAEGTVLPLLAVVVSVDSVALAVAVGGRGKVGNGGGGMSTTSDEEPVGGVDTVAVAAEEDAFSSLAKFVIAFLSKRSSSLDGGLCIEAAGSVGVVLLP